MSLNRAITPSGWTLVTAVSALLSLGIFFRFDIESGFNTLFGDRYDGLIETALLEHWFNVYRGLSHWSNTLFFFPTRGSLGYNDGYFLFGIPYSLCRATGIGPFLSAELTDILVKLCGFIGFVLFARRCVGLHAWSAIVGAVIFTTANNSFMSGNHVQLFAVGFAPLLATMAHELIAAVRAHAVTRAAIFGLLSALFLSSWLMTAFYTAYFFLLFALLLGFALALSCRVQLSRLVRVDMRVCWRPIALSLSVLVITMVPFLRLYLTKASETGMHQFSETFGFLGRAQDVLNLSGDSLLYSGLQRWLAPFMSGGGEPATGYTPLLLVVFLASGITALRARSDPSRRLIACMAVSAVALWLLTIRIGEVSLWRLVYDLVPGGKSIRVISRAQIFLQWPLTTIAVSGLDNLLAHARSQRPAVRAFAIIAMAMISLTLVAEQFNRWQVPQIDRKAELRWLHSVPRPPAGCRVFFVSKGRVGDPKFAQLTGLVEHNISAMFLAEWFGVPTINGFATFVPPRWSLLAIDQPSYLSRVQNYERRAGIATSCAIDLRDDHWSTVQTPPAR